MSKIDDLLSFDPLAAAEGLTGERMGESLNDETAALGLLFACTHSKMKRDALHEVGDTTYGDSLARYLSILDRLGFEQVLADEWPSSHNGVIETFFVFAHRDGLLLSFDTFRGNTVNAAKVSYNWMPKVDDWRNVRSSGHMNDGVWVGYHDAREALCHNLMKLRNRGEFVCPWIEQPFLWLLHYDDTKQPNYDYAAITSERISRLPQWVRDFISPAAQDAEGRTP
ncbi:hypothetical protein CCR97_08045 [Rhodoplanes elegans]|uniref:Uncharacterized protein n=1 Tax=Rhodoplanes elegans TaxID=29408 RepID=A0A327KNI1_9BRAD|nr:hypothetical protein [Rhodoplanes elegans]MBK5958070.1 hypothetical protein [Rhodoplanes elegans]MBK5958162.1 hypothetical protein [Rhodoplanes elegans]RAI40449.1 hypothetical protein CH338_06295 [Rhodoplanes elegans]